METRARICVNLIPGGENHVLSKLTASDGTAVLMGLSKRGLSRKSQGDYYSTFRRVLTLSGVSTHDWPRAPDAERHTREAILTSDAERVMERLRKNGYPETADIGLLLWATGLRVAIEGLARGNLEVRERRDTHILLHVTGKGGHERFVPVVDGRARALLDDAQRMEGIYRVPYTTHLARWNKTKAVLGVKTKLATFHSLRHNYATRVLEQSGGNLKMVQELLGHANPGTTARYASVNTDAKVKALLG